MDETNANSKTVSDYLYQFLFNDEDTRVWKDIPDSACPDVPQNFIRLTAARTVTKLGDELANAKIILPWLIEAVGASSFWVGFLVPIRESFSMLPQLIIAKYVRDFPIRKNALALSALLECASLVGMALIALFMRGPATGAAIVGLLLLFSLSRGLNSVASKEVVGKTIPKTRRGRLTGYAASISGFLTMLLGLALVAWVGRNASAELFALLLGIGAGLWLIAAGLFYQIAEKPGATSGGGNALSEAIQRVDILRTDAPFRRFVVVRALMISSALAAPYYVMLANQSGGGGEYLGYFVLASGVASALSSAVWGKWADVSSRNVLLTASMVASVLGFALFAFDHLGVFNAGFVWLIPIAFFILSIAHSGVRIGRKTYILDMADGEKRIDYVAVSNSSIGAILLASSSLGALAPTIGASGMLMLFALFSLAGVILGLRLEEVE